MLIIFLNLFATGDEVESRLTTGTSWAGVVCGGRATVESEEEGKESKNEGGYKGG